MKYCSLGQTRMAATTHGAQKQAKVMDMRKGGFVCNLCEVKPCHSQAPLQVQCWTGRLILWSFPPLPCLQATNPSHQAEA